MNILKNIVNYVSNHKKYAIIAFIFILSLSGICFVKMYNYSIEQSLKKEELNLKTDLSVIDKFQPIKKPGKAPVVLLIHGFAGSPHDLSPLTTKLMDNNVAVYSILLSGHGTSPRDLEQASISSWEMEVEKAYDELFNMYGSVDVVGFSFGGTLAIHLASQRKVNRLVLISPLGKVRMKWYYLKQPSWWSDKLKNVIPIVRKVKIGQINDPEGLSNYIAYRHFPISIIEPMERFAERTFNTTALNVRIPTLILHSEGDQVADFKQSGLLLNNIPSMNKEFVKYNKSNHILLYDYDRDDAINRIMKFLGHYKE